MRTGFAAVVIVTLGFVAPAFAAGPSFDCAKAKSDDEKAICADPKLAAKDRELAAVYQAALAAAGDDAALRERLRGEQAKWLKWRDGCAYGYVGAACLDTAMTRRMSLLKSLANDLALARRLRTIIVSDEGDRISAAYPTLDDGSPAAQAFNGTMQKAVAVDLAPYRNSGCDPEVFSPCPSVTTTAELFLPIRNLLSVQITTLGVYGLPNEHRKSLTFDLAEGRTLPAADIFVGAGWKAYRGLLRKKMAEARL